MKKITIKTLSEIAAVLPELSYSEQRCILGGTGSGESETTGCYVYSYDEMIYMIDTNTWVGGYVDGMGYMEEGSVSGHYYNGVYTEEEMFRLVYQKNWNGGWVNGEYLEKDCYASTGVFTFSEALVRMRGGEWQGGWIEGSGYIGSDVTGFAGVYDYSYDDMLVMMDNGTWTGGWVEGSGYINADYYVTGNYVTGAFYSYKEMESLIDAGKWEGGFVEEWGYVGEVAYVTGCVGGGIDSVMDFLRLFGACSLNLLDRSLDDFVFTGSAILGALEGGFSYMSLDIKYNNVMDFGYGRGRIPTQEAMNYSTIKAYNYSFSGGFEETTIGSGDPSIKEFSTYLSTIISMYPGSDYVSKGGKVGEILTNEIMGNAEGELMKEAVQHLMAK